MEEKANGISVEAISQLENDAEFHELVEKTRRLNIFEVLGITKTEIRHSNFLAWLLDPKEAHGLGDRFLRALDDLTSALETVDQNRPHNQLHPEYDRCFYSSGRYRYYEVLWAEQVSVQDLLAAIAEVQELIRNAEQEAAETVGNNGDIPGQIAMIGFFHPLTFHSRICTIYGG